MDLKEARRIEARIENGAWVDTVRHFPGVSLKVRGEGNTDHERYLMERYVALGGKATPEQDEEIEKDAILETILVDWKGLEEPFSRETAQEYLELRTFRRAVMESARIVGRRGTDALEEHAKNSEKPSSGTSSGARTSSGSKH